MTANATKVESLTVDWGEADKTPNQRRQWLAAWLVSRDGEEGDFFYDGNGGEVTAHAVPEDAVGYRIRWWESTGHTEAGGAQRGRANATRPVYFADDAGAQIAIAALAIAP